jgi:hypothetical protein
MIFAYERNTGTFAGHQDKSLRESELFINQATGCAMNVATA